MGGFLERRGLGLGDCSRLQFGLTEVKMNHIRCDPYLSSVLTIRFRGNVPGRLRAAELEELRRSGSLEGAR